MNVLLDGRLITTNPNTNEDYSYFDDPAYNRRIDAAVKLTGAARYRAYARLGDYLTHTATPFVPLANTVQQDLYSARIGCHVYAPSLDEADLAALCIRGRAH
jgi:ABC-type oligopeptide transport system substrate-binding subunit